MTTVEDASNTSVRVFGIGALVLASLILVQAFVLMLVPTATFLISSMFLMQSAVTFLVIALAVQLHKKMMEPETEETDADRKLPRRSERKVRRILVQQSKK